MPKQNESLMTETTGPLPVIAEVTSWLGKEHCIASMHPEMHAILSPFGQDRLARTLKAYDALLLAAKETVTKHPDTCDHIHRLWETISNVEKLK